MENILANSESDLKQINFLINKDIPSYRQAYSDRTAWVMSCLSELAYLKFNPLFSNEKVKDYFLENISKLASENKKSALVKLIDTVGYDPEKQEEILNNELSLLKIELIDKFNTNGTQAILVSFKDYIVLAFRGTEATSIKDIKADTKAYKTACEETAGKIHSGFKEAYDQVRFDVEKKINESQFQNKPLFITGHSLGGALATIAAKMLTHKGGIAACYTFGSPRVGDEDWIANIKTPIYRVVNAADCVTMLPPSSETITVIGWLLQIIPWVGGKSLRTLLLSKFGGYLHCGDMRYLSNCPKGQYKDVKLLYFVSIIFRIKGLIIKKLPWRKFLSDHSISVYRKKLTMVAKHNNSDTLESSGDKIERLSFKKTG